jgi:2-keto-3-deoxy-6-phosphogluconate aldolase
LRGFIPLFTKDQYDSRKLVEACVVAGLRVIEYTLRRPDAPEMIPWIRENFPDLHILIGSTMDSEPIVRRARNRHSHLLTLSELADMDVDGFVSIFGFSDKTIRLYTKTHLLIPMAMTLTEGLSMLTEGAHFIKMGGLNLDMLRMYRSNPTFQIFPIFATGGMTLETIPGTIEAGAMLVGTGIDQVIDGASESISIREIAGRLKMYTETTKSTIDRVWPQLAHARNSDEKTWLAALPHHHPFD